jgi:ATP-dependent DNA helicase RecQ
VSKLAAAGIRAVAVNSALSAHEEAAALGAVRSGDVEFVFTTPERLCTADFIGLLKRNKIDLVVVDEAHCISQWGHDFRPAFLEIGGAVEALDNPPLLALTATATHAVVEDIGRQLRRSFVTVNTGIYRPNLHYSVVHVTNDDEKQRHAVDIVRSAEGSVIVYAATIKAAEAAHASFVGAGLDAGLYHGRRPAKERAAQQEAFMRGDTPIMVATNAFGLGIDKPDVRLVLHYQIPGTLEAYYQEAGRAGRDGEQARCALLYDTRDKRVQQFFIGGGYVEGLDVVRVYDALAGRDARHKAVARADLFGRVDAVSGNRLKVAVKLLKDAGYIRQDRKLRYRLVGEEPARDALMRLADEYAHRSEVDREKLERMIFYAQTTFCRWKVLLAYFEEAEDFERCGMCDNCLHPPRPAAAKPRRQARIVPEPAASGFAAGAAVRVPRYGEGKVVAASSDQVEIVFPDGRRRHFLSAYVQPAAMPTSSGSAS